jgi:hypothetical protein
MDIKNSRGDLFFFHNHFFFVEAIVSPYSILLIKFSRSAEGLEMAITTNPISVSLSRQGWPLS